MKKKVNFFDKLLKKFRIGILDTKTGKVHTSDGKYRSKKDCDLLVVVEPKEKII